MSLLSRTTQPVTDIERLQADNTALQTQVRSLTEQLEWFKRQLFGRRSEKRLRVMDSAEQPLLDGLVDSETLSSSSPEPTEQITYERRKRKQRGEGCVTDEGLRFDESVPVQTINLSAPQLEGPRAGVRQHQRMSGGGIRLSRAALSTWVHRAAELLRPVVSGRDVVFAAQKHS